MSEQHRLRRLFTPRDVAIVGASESSLRARNAIEAMASRGVPLHLVNHRGQDVLGRHTARSLSELAESGIQVDAAILFTNAGAAVEVTAEAAALNVGGVIVNAAGFAEAGGEGVALQDKLVQAAGGMPVIGPNCNGIVAPALGLHLAGSPPGLPIAAGRLAFVTHSGATMMPMAIAGVERKIGYSYLVSTGNEAVVDMAEVVEFLATDDATSAICLLIETIRDPARFWAAIDSAIDAGKPVLALKNGRSPRGQAIARSHTGAVAGDAWIYESALRQHGVIVANDLVDLVDRAVLFDQVPRSKWNAASGLAIASGSGGFVTMASDVCAEEGLDLPALDELGDAIRQAVPQASVINPLDLTGAAMADPAVMASALGTFIASPQVDTVLIQSAVCDGGESALNAFAGPALEVAPTTNKLIIVGSIEGGAIGHELQRYRDRGIAVTRGMRATIRALTSMADFTTYTGRRRLERSDSATSAQAATAPLPVPTGVLEHPTAGRMLGFSATMDLLARFGIPAAPYTIIDADDDPTAAIGFAPPYVLKLADVPHRTDLGAVRLNVDTTDLEAVVGDLRAVAAEHGQPAAIAVQPMYRIHGELLLGVNAANELGPFVVCGLGGVFVEVIRQIAGRLAPLSDAEATRLIGEVNSNGVLNGPRGSTPWATPDLVRILRGVGDLAVASAGWLDSLDINPLALTDQGILALDALAILRPTHTETDAARSES